MFFSLTRVQAPKGKLPSVLFACIISDRRSSTQGQETQGLLSEWKQEVKSLQRASLCFPLSEAALFLVSAVLWGLLASPLCRPKATILGQLLLFLTWLPHSVPPANCSPNSTPGPFHPGAYHQLTVAFRSLCSSSWERVFFGSIQQRDGFPSGQGSIPAIPRCPGRP